MPKIVRLYLSQCLEFLDTSVSESGIWQKPSNFTEADLLRHVSFHSDFVIPWLSTRFLRTTARTSFIHHHSPVGPFVYCQQLLPFLCHYPSHRRWARNSDGLWVSAISALAPVPALNRQRHLCKSFLDRYRKWKKSLDQINGQPFPGCGKSNKTLFLKFLYNTEHTDFAKTNGR